MKIFKTAFFSRANTSRPICSLPGPVLPVPISGLFFEVNLLGDAVGSAHIRRSGRYRIEDPLTCTWMDRNLMR
jgi:hypothetical protein